MNQLLLKAKSSCCCDSPGLLSKNKSHKQIIIQLNKPSIKIKDIGQIRKSFYDKNCQENTQVSKSITISQGYACSNAPNHQLIRRGKLSDAIERQIQSRNSINYQKDKIYYKNAYTNNVNTTKKQRLSLHHCRKNELNNLNQKNDKIQEFLVDKNQKNQHNRKGPSFQPDQHRRKIKITLISRHSNQEDKQSSKISKKCQSIIFQNQRQAKQPILPRQASQKHSQSQTHNLSIIKRATIIQQHSTFLQIPNQQINKTKSTYNFESRIQNSVEIYDSARMSKNISRKFSQNLQFNENDKENSIMHSNIGTNSVLFNDKQLHFKALEESTLNLSNLSVIHQQIIESKATQQNTSIQNEIINLRQQFDSLKVQQKSLSKRLGWQKSYFESELAMLMAKKHKCQTKQLQRCKQISQIHQIIRKISLPKLDLKI